MKLTAKAIAAIALPEGKSDFFTWDEDLPGFGYRLRLGAGGKVLKSWVCQYKRSGNSRRMTFDAVLGAEQARAEARKVLAKVELGQDPQGEKTEQRDRDRLSMKSQVGAYLDGKRSKLAERSMIEATRYLTDPRYFGTLHGKPLDGIKRRDVADRVVAIDRACGAATAARARGTLSSFFAWAMQMGLVEANPTIGTIRPATVSRERVLSNDELVAIWRACGDDEFGKIVQLLILTGCRRSEIGDMRWGEIDLDRATFTIPPSRSKNKRPHALPLMPAALDIIRSVPRMATRDQLFGSRSHGFTVWDRSKIALDQRLGDSVGPWCLHDLRRTAATGMNDIGVQPHIVEQILNHVSGHRRGIVGVYNKSPYTNEVRAALALWEDHIRALVEGAERKVVPLEAKRGY
jgi:integrase